MSGILVHRCGAPALGLVRHFHRRVVEEPAIAIELQIPNALTGVRHLTASVKRAIVLRYESQGRIGAARLDATSLVSMGRESASEAELSMLHVRLDVHIYERTTNATPGTMPLSMRSNAPASEDRRAAVLNRCGSAASRGDGR